MQTEGGGKMPPVADREEILHFYTGVMRGKIHSGGKAAAVVTAAESEHSSRLASKELADYVEKSSGVRPAEAVGLPPEGVPSVLIGTLGKFPGEVPEAAKKAPPASGSGSCCRLRFRRTWTRRSMYTTRCMSTMCP